MNALVTIITPCYNGEAFLDNYFRSILAQTYSPIELIFVNDGSVDRTEEIALSYREALENKGITYKYLYQPNGGQAKAMNTGFREMTGEYLIWPDSDDLLAPDSIAKRVAFLEAHPEYALVRSNGYFYDFDTGRPLRRVSDKDNRFQEDIFLDMILEETYCCCGCYMIRTSPLRNVYPDLTIDESYAGQNWQILIPMAGKHLCGYIDEDLYQIMERPNSHSRQKRTLEETVDRYRELRRVLEDGIRLSGRKDRDYTRIVENKYLKILLLVYMRYNDLKNAERCFRQLRRNKSLDGYEVPLYLKTVHPARYQMFVMGKRFVRLLRKLRRPEQKNK